MTPQHRQRLLGFVLLMSVAVIFLPLLLDGEGYRQRQMDTEIPPVPESPPWAEFTPEREPLASTAELAPPRPQPTPDPVLPEPVADAPARDETPGDEITAMPTLAADPPVLDTQGVPVAWTLQLASFRDHDNASKLRAKLLKAGYTAYLSKKDGLTQVFVGPDIQRSSVETLRQRLKQDFGLDGLVLRFTPR